MEDHGRGVYRDLMQYEKLAALGPDGIRCRPRAEQSPRHDSDLVGAPRRAVGRRADQARHRNHTERVRTRREDRPQSADVLAQAPHDARDGGCEPGGTRDAVTPDVRPAGLQHHHDRRTGYGPSASVRRRASAQAGAPEPGHQRRAGHAVGERARHTHRPYVARGRRRVRGPGDQRRRSGHPRRRPATYLRRLLHDEVGRDRDRPRTDGGQQNRRGSRRQARYGVHSGAWRLVLHASPHRRRPAAPRRVVRTAGAACCRTGIRGAPGRERTRARRSRARCADGGRIPRRPRRRWSDGARTRADSDVQPGDPAT